MPLFRQSSVSTLWGISVALSWTWGLGLFFSVQISLQFGLGGLLAFAIPNAIGLLCFGLFTSHLARRQGEQRALEKFFFTQSHPLRFIFIVYQFIAVALTFFAALKYLFIPMGIDPWLAMLLLIGIAFILGEQFSISQLKYSHAAIFAVMVAAALGLSYGASQLVTGVGGLPDGWTAGEQPFFSLGFVGFLVPICIGLLLGPWLDIQQWQRVIQLQREGGSIRLGYLIGSILFFCIILFHGILAKAVHGTSQFVFAGVGQDRLFHAKEYLTVVFFGEVGSTLLRLSYVVFILAAIVSTLDSGYIAFRWYLKELVSKAEHIIMSIVPESVFREPAVPMLLAVAVAVATIPFGVQLEYYMAFYGTFSVGYSIVLIARTIMKPELSDISQATLFAVACFSLGLFGIGYFQSQWYLMALGALIPAVHGIVVISGRVVVDDLSRAVPQTDAEKAAATALPSVSGMAAEKAVHALETAIARLDPKVAAKFSDIIHRIEPTAAHALANVLHAIHPAEIASNTGAAPQEAHNADALHARGRFEGKWFTYTFMATYQDTNSVGNVYFGTYLLWVGKIREMFFEACMPEFDLKTTSFYILTRQIEHKFNTEAKEFELITARIRVESFNRKFATLEHEIFNEAGTLLGKGKQTLLFVKSSDYSIIDIPDQVKKAFVPRMSG